MMTFHFRTGCTNTLCVLRQSLDTYNIHIHIHRVRWEIWYGHIINAKFVFFIVLVFLYFSLIFTILHTESSQNWNSVQKSRQMRCDRVGIRSSVCALVRNRQQKKKNIYWFYSILFYFNIYFLSLTLDPSTTWLKMYYAWNVWMSPYRVIWNDWPPP